MSPVFAPPLTPVGQILCTQPGAYSFLGTKASTSATLGNSTTRAMSIWVPEPVILDRIGAEVTIVGEAGCKIRLGIWADAGNATLPAALILDAGTINGDSATVQEITISQFLAPGVYWLSGTLQSAPTTQPTARVADERVALSISDTAATSAVRLGAARTDVGALAAAWGTALSVVNVMPRIFVRIV